MRTLKDIEAYLARLQYRFDLIPHPENETSATYVLHAAGHLPPIALRVDPPLVVLRVRVGQVPSESSSKGSREALFRKLLELNASAVVHVSYGLDGNQMVLSGALELENLDLNELEAVLDEVELTLSEHVPMLVELSQTKS